MKPVLAIVGRPNVGKSTLFNRLVGQRRSITDPTPGVTRDRIYGEAEWLGRQFVAIDTGGWQEDNMQDASLRRIVGAIRHQVERALNAADAILLLVDAREGLTGLDEQLADMVRARGIPVILGVNKVDSTGLNDSVNEFYRLGLGTPIPISAEHGRNTGDLLDAVIAVLPFSEESDVDDPHEPVRVAIVGRPNVGKSSLMNALLHDERVMVSETPGTTRDAVEVEWYWEGQAFVFVDTAGLRRRARIDQIVEKYSVSSALRAVRKSDVVLLILDSQEMVTEQDQRVASYTQDQGKAAVVVVNKWDLVESDPLAWNAYQRMLDDRLYFIDYALRISTSAASGLRISRLPSLVMEAYRHYKSEIRTSDLNRIIREIVGRHEPPAQGGRKLRIYYATQVVEGPPTFLLFTNDPRLITANYRRYLERHLRRALGLVGTPIRLLFRKSE